jgi:hypothetical protein
MPRRRENVRVVWIIAIAIGLLVGVVIGRASEGSPPVEAPKQASPGPDDSEFGVPTGFAHSEAGAVAALLNYASALGDPRVLLDPRRLEQVLSVVATRRYAATFEGRGGVAIEAVRRGPLGQGLAAGARTAYFATPIAYRIASYSSAQAVVEGWGVSVVGNAEGLEPQATWGKTLTTLRWDGRDWRVDAVESKDGPTPSLAEGQVPSTAPDFLARLDGLRGVRHAP